MGYVWFLLARALGSNKLLFPPPEEERQLDFQWLRAHHYQRFLLKTLHTIVEGLTRVDKATTRVNNHTYLHCWW